MAQAIFYFGKYKGMPVEDVPIDYLKWVSNNCQLSGETRKAVFLRLGKETPPTELELAVNGNVKLARSMGGLLGYTKNGIMSGQFNSLDEVFDWFEDRYSPRFPELSTTALDYWQSRLALWWENDRNTQVRRT